MKLLKILVIPFAAIVGLGPVAYADNRPIFSPDGKKLFVLIETAGGTSLDADPKTLLNLMSVPVQQVSGGQGKIFESTGGEFVFSCVYQNDPSNVLCTIALKGPAQTIAVSSSAGAGSYNATATDAARINKFFKTDVNHELHWTSRDNEITIDSTPTSFAFAYQR